MGIELSELLLNLPDVLHELGLVLVLRELLRDLLLDHVHQLLVVRVGLSRLFLHVLVLQELHILLLSQELVKVLLLLLRRHVLHLLE